MSTEQNKAIVRRYIEEVWNQQNFGAIYELFVPNYTIHQGSQSIKTSHEALKQGIVAAHDTFPDFHMTIDNLVGQGDKTAAHWTNSGTQKGSLRLPESQQNIPASDKKVEFAESAIFRIEGSRIAEGWYVSDRLSMLQQLGVVPSIGARR
jgi:predicted ester cyclase